MGKTYRNPRNNNKDHDKIKKLQYQLEEAEHEIKRLRNIIKRINPQKLKEALTAQQPKEEKPAQPACERCGSHKLKNININRIDGTFKITICQIISCNHRTMIKVEETND